MQHFLLIQFILININFLYTIQLENYEILNKECEKNMNIKEAYLEKDSNINFLLEITRGKIPIKLEESLINKFDLNLIKRLNKNIPCVYKLSNNYSYNPDINKTMYFLGAGINLANYNPENMDDILKNPKMHYSERQKYVELMKAIERGNESEIINISSKPFTSLETFNSLVMNNAIENYQKTAKDNKLYKSPLINALLSLYFTLYDGYDELKRYLNINVKNISYQIEYLPEVFTYSRLIQSKLIFMMDGNFKYNRNHIFFVIPLFLFEENDFNKIKEIINSIYTNVNDNNYNLNPSRISILGINKNNNCSNFIINYNNKNNLDIFFKTDYKNKEEIIDLDIIYQNLDNLFNKNKNQDYFENKIAIFFANYQSKFSVEPHRLLNIFDKYKKSYNIQTIPIINNVDSIENRDIFKYNIFYKFSDSINIAPIRLAISYMHINIDFSEENQKEIRINNIYLNDIDAPNYIEVNFNKGINKSEYYEISLEIKQTSRYNIFISDTNPYPSIRNNIKNFLKFENNNNPILTIKSHNLDKFYIGIEGLLFFNISITRKYSENNTDDNPISNNGEYEYVNYGVPVTFGDGILNLHTFNKNNSDYRIYSNIFKNESVENMTKYFLRGIEIENTNYESFLNYELILYLYGSTYLINRVYKDNSNNYYFGRYINLSLITPNDIKNAGFDRLFINKIFSFFNIDSKLNNSAPGISFNEDELKLIFNLTYSQYIKELKPKIQKYPNCIPFEDQKPNMKFIIFCLYFSYYYDKNIIKNIINLSLREPKFSEVLNFLREKKQENDFFLINFISQMEQEDKLEKIMVSLIIGKSLALSDIGTNFVKSFYNFMDKAKTKISLSIYDSLNKKKIKKIIQFSSTTNPNLEEIDDYNKSSYGDRNKYNQTQKMEFDKIINFGLSQFSKFDYGIKKIIIIVSDENISKDNFIINNELTIKDNVYEKREKLIDNQIDILLISSKNFEKGEIPDFFKNERILKNNNNQIPYSLYDNYFHVSNLNNITMYMNGLCKKIKNSAIKMYCGKRLINDFYQRKITYYEINYPDDAKNVIVIKANINKFNIYFSATNPFPSLINDTNIRKLGQHEIVITNEKSNGRIYVGLQPNNTVEKQRIEIFSCQSYYPDNNCKLIGNNGNRWMLFVFLLFGFILLFLIYKCKSKLSSDINIKNKKRLNVFDKIK